MLRFLLMAEWYYQWPNCSFLYYIGVKDPPPSSPLYCLHPSIYLPRFFINQILSSLPPTIRPPPPSGETKEGQWDMVGLSLVLKVQKSINKKTPQVFNKITMMTKPTIFPSPATRWNSHSPLFPTTTTFLDECFLCKQKLLPGKDIYMYKGDKAFCMWS